MEVSDEQTPKPWDRQSGESNWYPRFLLYRDMPHSVPPMPRTLFGAASLHQSQRGGKKLTGTPPAWIDASRKWNWKERAEAYDAHLQQEREAIAASERVKVLTTGYALMHERVKTLDVLAKKLVADVAKGRLYRQDVRSVGTGKDAHQVAIELFDEGVIRELRACLADIAAEMGERVKKSEVAVTDFPKVYLDVGELEDGVDP